MGDGQGLRERSDPELCPLRIDEAHFSGADPLVDPVLVVVNRWGYATSLLDRAPAVNATRAGAGKQRPPTAADQPGRIVPRRTGGRVGAGAPLSSFGFIVG